MTQGRRPISVKTLIAAVPGSGGNKTTIAKRAGVSWHTVHNYIKKHSTLRKVYQMELEGILDETEDKLVEAVRKGEPWAIKFLLKTKGKKRGFTEQLDIDHKSGGRPLPPVSRVVVELGGGGPGDETPNAVEEGG